VNVNPLILGSKKTASLEFSLRDCRTGELLWKGDGATSEAKGFLFAGINGYTILCEQLITMSRYQEPGKVTLQQSATALRARGNSTEPVSSAVFWLVWPGFDCR